MSQQWHLISGLDDFVSCLQHAKGIANILSQHPGRVGQRAIVAVELLAGHTVISTPVPLDFQLGSCLLGTPVAIRQHYHTGSDRFDLDDTGHRQRFGCIKTDH